MTTLEKRIKALIRADGPIPLSVYLQICLHDPVHGYYATMPGIARDFVTAPELSQIFGELIGLWCVDEWRRIGCPDPCHWIELGPGRGTLAADTLRTMRIDRACARSMRPTLVEASPVLRDEQRRRLGRQEISWHEGLDSVPAAPTLLVANEFLDCLPFRRFFRSDDGAWQEQRVGVDARDRLHFGRSSATRPPHADPDARAAILCPAMERLVAVLAERFAAHPGRALFFDYGIAGDRNGELRAFSVGRHVSALERPGEVDLTADVDFDAFVGLASAAGLDVAGPVPQGLFLERLGARERLAKLTTFNPDEADGIEAGADRLLSEQDMGGCYGVVCLSTRDLPAPSGFAEAW